MECVSRPVPRSNAAVVHVLFAVSTVPTFCEPISWNYNRMRHEVVEELAVFRRHYRSTAK